MNDTTDERAMREALSALADGEAIDSAQWTRVRQAWSSDPALRREWQLLQLAGEALRVPEMAAPAQSAQALLQGLRTRLAQEPVAIEQARLKRRQGTPRSLREMLPALAVAAGFVLVALIVPGSLRVAPAGGVNIAMAPVGFPGTAGAVASEDAFASGPTFAQTLSPLASQPQVLAPQLGDWPHDTLSVWPAPAAPGGVTAPAEPPVAAASENH